MASEAFRATVSCLMCGSGRLDVLYEGVHDHAGVSPDPYRFLKCRECGSATLDPMPLPETIPALYPPDYTFKADTTGQGAVGRLLKSVEWGAFYRPIYLQRLGIFRRLTGMASGLVLEVGCGSGLFLRLLAEAGYEVEGLDISTSDVEYANTRLGLKVYQGSVEDQTLPADRYDAVLVMSVLEHVPDPLETVRRVFRILKPGGWIVLGLPMIESWQSRMLRARWCAVTEAPRHLMVPSSEGVRRLLAQAGGRDFRAAPGSLIDNAGDIVLSLIPGVSTPHSYGRSASFLRTVRRWLGAALVLPALGFAYAERLPHEPRSGYMIFAARK
jgi:SAM-dependent methyltransferase